MRSIRFFGLLGYRNYYDKPKNTNPESSDFQLGFDYYLDNIFEETSFAYLVWSNLTFRRTNYAISDYKTILWMGNIKLGPKFDICTIINNPYFVFDWTSSPKYSSRFWENFLRIGFGYQIYPFKSQTNFFPRTLTKRTRLYFEYIFNNKWLKDEPTNNINTWDIRVGLAFSTGGYLKEY